MAMYYRHDGQPIPSPGIIVIGKIDSDVEALREGQVRNVARLLRLVIAARRMRELIRVEDVA